MGSGLFHRVQIHHPQSTWELVLTAAIIVGITLSSFRLAGAPFAAVGATLGVVTFVLLEPHPYIPGGLLLALVLTRRAVLAPGAWQRAGYLLQEMAFLGAGFILYEFGRMHTIGDRDVALRNAQRVVDFQAWLGLPKESVVQDLILKSDTALTVFNRIYSFTFLATTVGTLLWLCLNDRRNYRLMQAGLVSSTALTVLTVWLFPVAPPRLLPNYGLFDTHALTGREHGFLNPYAAVPSNHVGWMVLTGVVLGRSIGGRRGLAIGMVPGTVMGFTVLATGNHYWVDGIVGSIFAMVPFMALGLVALYRQRPGLVLAPVRYATAHYASIALAGLLSWLLLGRLLAPPLSDFWGYQVGQVSATLAVVAIGEGWRRRTAIFSWETRTIVAATTYADTLGTAGHLYDRYAVYDKITHFAGTAAITAICFEVVTLLLSRGRILPPTASPVLMAIGFGVFCGFIWEVYEYLGDAAFNTGRVQGRQDTWHDLVSDTAGAVVATLLLARRRTAEQERAREAAPGTGSAAVAELTHATTTQSVGPSSSGLTARAESDSLSEAQIGGG